MVFLKHMELLIFQKERGGSEFGLPKTWLCCITINCGLQFHTVLTALFFRFDIVDVPLLKIINETWESGLEDVFVIYDSACCYKVNFHTRCQQNPHTPLDKKFWDRIAPESFFLKWFVNAFHQYSHNPECADDHSL